MSIELCNERIHVCAVNDASFFKAFSAGSRAAEAVHTDFDEIDCCCRVKVKNIADDAFSCDFHGDTKPFYINFERSGFSRSFFSCAKKIPQQYYFIIFVF